MTRYWAFGTHDGYVEMRAHPDGAYVLFSDVQDYLALLRELNDALVIPGWLQPRVDAVLDAAPVAAPVFSLNENDEPLRELCYNYRNAGTIHAENYFQRIVRWVKQQAVRQSFSTPQK